MRQVGFILEDGFQVMGLAALSAFEFANTGLGREAYGLRVMSERAAPSAPRCASASRPCLWRTPPTR